MLSKNIKYKRQTNLHKTKKTINQIRVKAHQCKERNKRVYKTMLYVTWFFSTLALDMPTKPTNDLVYTL